MTQFMAMKIHYDHRKSLPSYLKYSKVPSEDEYNEYLALYESGVGGQGFHECLNFAIPETGNVKIYFPPTCLPSQNLVNEEFIIFSFTYKQDQELPSVVLGVHAGVSIDNLEGIIRSDYKIDGGVEDLFYHASSDSDLTTLFTSPLSYNFKEGIYTPVYRSWGYGNRYVEERHALNMLNAAYDNAKNSHILANGTKKIVVEREIYVLENILQRYFGIKPEKRLSNNIKSTIENSSIDKEIGYKGELAVYNKELEYVKSIGLSKDSVEWLSQGVPSSVFDIKSVRKKENKILEHYIEVKSSKLNYGDNIYISSRQVDFFKENIERTSIALVNFNEDTPDITYKTFDQLNREFLLEPIKFKLIRK